MKISTSRKIHREPQQGSENNKSSFKHANISLHIIDRSTWRGQEEGRRNRCWVWLIGKQTRLVLFPRVPYYKSQHFMNLLEEKIRCHCYFLIIYKVWTAKMRINVQWKHIKEWKKSMSSCFQCEKNCVVDVHIRTRKADIVPNNKICERKKKLCTLLQLSAHVNLIRYTYCDILMQCVQTFFLLSQIYSTCFPTPDMHAYTTEFFHNENMNMIFCFLLNSFTLR